VQQVTTVVDFQSISVVAPHQKRTAQDMHRNVAPKLEHARLARLA
jgi:hypothetical protein